MRNFQLYNAVIPYGELERSLKSCYAWFGREARKNVSQVRSFDPEVPCLYAPNNGVIICITPRSGSTALSEAISNTTKRNGTFLGYPGESFNVGYDVMGKRSEHYACKTFDDYAYYAFKEATDASGTFATKGDFCQLYPLFDTEYFVELSKQVKWVYLRRNDIVEQAVSLARAHKYGVWNSGSSFAKNFTLTVDEIIPWMHIIAGMESAWRIFFDINGINPYIIEYSNLSASLPDVACDLFKYVTGREFPTERIVSPAQIITRNVSSKESGVKLKQKVASLFSR